MKTKMNTLSLIIFGLFLGSSATNLESRIYPNKMMKSMHHKTKINNCSSSTDKIDVYIFENGTSRVNFIDSNLINIKQIEILNTTYNIPIPLNFNGTCFNIKLMTTNTVQVFRMHHSKYHHEKTFNPKNTLGSFNVITKLVFNFIYPINTSKDYLISFVTSKDYINLYDSVMIEQLVLDNTDDHTNNNPKSYSHIILLFIIILVMIVVIYFDLKPIKKNNNKVEDISVKYIRLVEDV